MAQTAYQASSDGVMPDIHFKHFLLTRFNYRGPSFTGRSSDPLKPARLRQRLQLLEGIVLPSITSQTSQDFTWVVIVDKDLPVEFRKQLASMLSRIENTAVIDYEDDDVIFHLDWLRPLLNEPTQYIITTNVDDDDAIHSDYVAECQAVISKKLNGDRLPSIFAIGSSRYLQWDIIWGRNAALGYFKPWSRSTWPTNAGLTLCTHTRVHNISALAINRHTQLPNLLNALTPDCRGEVRGACESHGEDLQQLTGGGHFYDLAIDGDHPRVLIGNHFLNTQISRIFESRHEREPFNANHFERFRVNERIVRQFVNEYGKAGAWLFPRYTQVAWKLQLRKRRRLKRIRAVIQMPAAATEIAWNILKESKYSKKAHSPPPVAR